METNYQKTYARVGQKAIITSEGGKILVLKRLGSGDDARWSLPGGALEKGEDPTVGIIREIKEETGFDISSITPFAIRSYLNKENDFVIIIGYQCKTNLKELVLNEEHTDFKWLTRDDALKLDLSSDGKYFIEKFEGY